MSDGGCARCGGLGTVVGAKDWEVAVPAGAADGLELRRPGEGAEHAWRPAGDVVFRVQTAPHARFERDGDALVYRARVPLLEALVGFERRLTLLDGERLEVAHARAAFGDFARAFGGRGLPVAGAADGARGELRVEFEVAFPPSLSALQLAVLASVLREDELATLVGIMRLLSFARTVEVGDGLESVYCSRCAYDPGGDPRFCYPDARWRTWWRAMLYEGG